MSDNVFVDRTLKTSDNVVSVLDNPTRALARISVQLDGTQLIISPYRSGTISQTDGRVDLSVDKTSPVFIGLDLQPDTVGAAGYAQVLVVCPEKIDRDWLREVYAPAVMAGTRFIMAGEQPGGENTGLGLATNCDDFRFLWDPIFSTADSEHT